METDLRHFVDRQTGEVLSLLEEDMDEEDIERLDAEPDRYLLIEPVPSCVSYEVMSDFVDTLPEGKSLASELGPFSKDIRFAGLKTCCSIIQQFERTGFGFTNKPS